MESGKNQGNFIDTLLPVGEKRWTSFGTGLALECIALALLIILPLLMPQRLQLAVHHYVTILDVPALETWKPQPQLIKRHVAAEVAKAAVQPAPVMSAKHKIYDPVFRTPLIHVSMRKVTSVPTVARALPNPKVSMGSSALPKLRVPVQTGGFGDPRGAPDNGKRDRNPNIALLGSFDGPIGPGVGNGSGGAHGARGTITSSGFGSGVAVAGSDRGSRGTVQEGVFANKQAAPVPHARKAPIDSDSKPVIILTVPRPIYTPEGRASRIQGVVLLQVVFTASGDVEVERVVKGLGFGLDESAENAARQIQFRPATRGGRPTDSSAIARIVFELAY
jgi:TonB family protein